ncbi:MAG: sulfite exporter TauE/SafE family protein [Verrucomicrobiales bacterium]|nr:sulfite exporter TauE/SafE family protein [Verrucomicrobiales bacterium]
MDLPFDSTWPIISLALSGAFCLGIAKTGFPGLALVNILIIAECFGAKASVGIILPLLILCDVIVYPLFRQYSSWSKVWPLLPPTLAGLAIGYFLLDAIDDSTARKVIGGIILVMVVLQLFREYQKSFLENLPASKFFLSGSGLAIGVSTMVANAAGPVYSIYALVHKMAKHDFLGVGARFFLLVNLIKVPLLGNLSLINADSLKLNLLLIPGIVAGIFSGKKLIHLVPQRIFEWLLYLFSLIAGLRLLIWS